MVESKVEAYLNSQAYIRKPSKAKVVELTRLIQEFSSKLTWLSSEMSKPDFKTHLTKEVRQKLTISRSHIRDTIKFLKHERKVISIQ